MKELKLLLILIVLLVVVVLLSLVPAEAQGITREQGNQILQEQRSLRGMVQDAIDQREFQAGQQRLNDQANQSARDGQAAAQATQRANEAAQQQMQQQRR